MKGGCSIITVLIVDDEKLIREGMKAQIPWKELNVDRVLLAQSGHQALEIMQKEKPQLMIADINMPEMSGIQLIEEAYRILPELIVIVLTGYDYFEYARDALRLHVTDYLLKPVDEQQLCTCVKTQTDLLLSREKKSTRVSDDFQKQLTKERMIHSLMDNMDSSQLENLEKELHLESDSLLQPVLVSIRPPSCTAEEEDLLLHQIRLFCLYEVDSRGIGFSIPEPPSKQLRFILISDCCPDGTEHTMYDLLELLRSEFSIDAHAHFGEIFRGLSGLSQACKTLCAHSLSEAEHTGPNLNFVPSMPVTDPGEVFRLYHETIEHMNHRQQPDEMIRWNIFQFLCNFYYSCATSGISVPDGILSKALSVLKSAERCDCVKLGEEYLHSMLSGSEKEMNELVFNALQYIDSHLTEAISVSSIADMLFVSPNYFSRLFKKTTGEGCNEYIVRKRMEMAQNLLEQTTYPSARIAELVGYNDTNYFSLAFRKNCGTTPIGWRKAHAVKKPGGN